MQGWPADPDGPNCPHYTTDVYGEIIETYKIVSGKYDSLARSSGLYCKFLLFRIHGSDPSSPIIPYIFNREFSRASRQGKVAAGGGFPPITDRMISDPECKL